jgi:hypothetical protein
MDHLTDPLTDKLQILFTFNGCSALLVEADKETDEQNYLLWRLQMGVAEGSTEIPKGRFYPLNVMLAIFAVFF